MAGGGGVCFYHGCAVHSRRQTTNLGYRFFCAYVFRIGGSSLSKPRSDCCPSSNVPLCLGFGFDRGETSFFFPEEKGSSLAFRVLFVCRIEIYYCVITTSDSFLPQEKKGNLFFFTLNGFWAEALVLFFSLSSLSLSPLPTTQCSFSLSCCYLCFDLSVSTSFFFQ